MGWTVLYIAFGVVALWLLGEVLFQYKARLRWRLLALGGFLLVVVGALIPSVLVIGAGIAAFGTGQTFVTLSYRRGFSTGWALGGSPGTSRRRRGGARGARDADPSLEVSDLQAHPPGAPPPPDFDAGPATAAYGDAFQNTDFAGNDFPANDFASNDFAGKDYASNDFASNDFQHPDFQGAEASGGDSYGDGAVRSDADAFGYGGYGHPEQAETTAMPAYSDDFAAFPGYPDHGVPQQQPVPDQQQYAAYTDQGYPGTYPGYDPQQPAGYDYAGAGYGDYGYGGQQAPYVPTTPYYTDVPDTPPGGVWVPQQREAAPPPLPPDQPAPYGYPEDPQYPPPYDPQGRPY